LFFCSELLDFLVLSCWNGDFLCARLGPPAATKDFPFLRCSSVLRDLLQGRVFFIFVRPGPVAFAHFRDCSGTESGLHIEDSSSYADFPAQSFSLSVFDSAAAARAYPKELPSSRSKFNEMRRNRLGPNSKIGEF
jgi:hypothetical protein